MGAQQSAVADITVEMEKKASAALELLDEEDDDAHTLRAHAIDCCSIASSYQSISELDEFLKPGETPLNRWSVRSLPGPSEIMNNPIFEGDELHPLDEEDADHDIDAAATRHVESAMEDEQPTAEAIEGGAAKGEAAPGPKTYPLAAVAEEDPPGSASTVPASAPAAEPLAAAAAAYAAGLASALSAPEATLPAVDVSTTAATTTAGSPREGPLLEVEILGVQPAGGKGQAPADSRPASSLRDAPLGQSTQQPVPPPPPAASAPEVAKVVSAAVAAVIASNTPAPKTSAKEAAADAPAPEEEPATPAAATPAADTDALGPVDAAAAAPVAPEPVAQPATAQTGAATADSAVPVAAAAASQNAAVESVPSERSSQAKAVAAEPEATTVEEPSAAAAAAEAPAVPAAAELGPASPAAVEASAFATTAEEAAAGAVLAAAAVPAKAAVPSEAQADDDSPAAPLKGTAAGSPAADDAAKPPAAAAEAASPGSADHGEVTAASLVAAPGVLAALEKGLAAASGMAPQAVASQPAVSGGKCEIEEAGQEAAAVADDAPAVAVVGAQMPVEAAVVAKDELAVEASVAAVMQAVAEAARAPAAALAAAATADTKVATAAADAAAAGDAVADATLAPPASVAVAADKLRSHRVMDVDIDVSEEFDEEGRSTPGKAGTAHDSTEQGATAETKVYSPGSCSSPGVAAAAAAGATAEGPAAARKGVQGILVDAADAAAAVNNATAHVGSATEAAAAAMSTAAVGLAGSSDGVVTDGGDARPSQGDDIKVVDVAEENSTAAPYGKVSAGDARGKVTVEAPNGARKAKGYKGSKSQGLRPKAGLFSCFTCYTTEH